jgi:hypothetical protein
VYSYEFLELLSHWEGYVVGKLFKINYNPNIETFIQSPSKNWIKVFHFNSGTLFQFLNQHHPEVTSTKHFVAHFTECFRDYYIKENFVDCTSVSNSQNFALETGEYNMYLLF